MKVLGRPLLYYHLERLLRAKTATKTVVATTEADGDQVIVGIANSMNVEVVRGDERDVLARYYAAAEQFRADVVVRVTSDCPLIDPEILDLCVSTFLQKKGECDYLSNCLVRTFPKGLDVEVFSRQALERAYREALEPEEREHVSLYMYGADAGFRLGSVSQKADESWQRWTVDTAADFHFVSSVIEALYPRLGCFSHLDCQMFLRENPGLLEINSVKPGF